ncbi:MAG: hypothetical protein HYT80_05390 [Euryarchaeota archaeon]|nr:hypothetical protein [Euryarchaeota archaeon]
MVRVAVLLASLLLAAGCLEEPSKGAASPLVPVPGLDVSAAFEAIRADMASVPCKADTVSSTASSANVKQLATSPLNELGGAHSHAEFDLHGDLLLDSMYNNKGFTLVNVSNPLEPVQVGFFVDPTPSTPGRGSSSTLDVKFSHDGNNVFLGYNDAVALVDVSDRTKPKLVQTMPNPTGYRAQAHMVYDAKIGNGEYLFVFPSISGEHVVVHKMTGSGPDARLTYLTMYTFVTPTAPTRQPVAPHDGFVMFDPVENHTLLYLANSFYGVQVINVDDPAQPQWVTTIAANADGTPTGYLPSFYHTVQAAWIDGKRIIATSAEVGHNTLKVFDATNLKAPKFLGQWVFNEQQSTNMQHNLQIVNGTLFEAHYQQGLFGFDLRSYLQNPTPKLSPSFHFQPATGGSIWDVVVRKGLAYVSNTPQGVHVVGYGCFAAGTESLTSDG